jgi:hypothetical protein
MSYVHAAVSMSPSTGVVRQMAEEALAAATLGLDWTTWLCQASDLSPTLRRCPAWLRYALLRLRFYFSLVGLARRGHRIVLRHSPGDPFLFLASFFLGSYFTVHHTLEEAELAASKFPFSRLQLKIERALGRRVVSRACGIVCLTPEIARHQLDRLAPRPRRMVCIFPNGILYPESGINPIDRRGDRPDVIFVASYFFDWHGLEALLDSISGDSNEGLLHLVGTLPESVKRKGERIKCVQIHGPLGPLALSALMARCWLGLSSFGLNSKGMTEACSLKVREYLRAGLPVYAGHRDSALPPDFEYYRRGPPLWSEILTYAREMRSVSRSTIAATARPLIDKKELLERLHRCLAGKI